MNTAAGNYEPEQIPARTEMTSLVTLKEGIRLIIEQQAEIKQRLAAIERQQKGTQEGLLIWMEAQREAISAIEQGQREESKLIFNAIMGFNERVKVIEQGQGVLCERLDGLAERLPTKLFAELASIERLDALSEQAACIRAANLRVEGEIKRKLDCLQAKELLSQFKAKPKRRRK